MGEPTNVGTYEVPSAGQAEGERPVNGAAPTSRRTLNSLKWALAIPVLGVVAGFLGQYPYGIWVGVVIAIGVVAAAAIIAGGVWHRAGAATLASVAALALPFFAGPGLYELYVKQVGERVHAVVADTGERQGVKRTTELSVCRVVDTSGIVRDVSEQQNCYGQFKPGQHVILFEDPLGALDPWIEALPGDRTVDPLTLGITTGLFLVTGSALLHAGQRRRSETDMVKRSLKRRHS
ncbi:hypothetical protein [Streptomyces phaeochromogenes]|uniref:hypothetical protein n=1 Tax=Streptomyces phaeochromogenes TaxID=1923 RepID=UPI0033F02CF2